jgi:hypothetical protein
MAAASSNANLALIAGGLVLTRHPLEPKASMMAIAAAGVHAVHRASIPKYDPSSQPH